MAYIPIITHIYTVYIHIYTVYIHFIPSPHIFCFSFKTFKYFFGSTIINARFKSGHTNSGLEGEEISI